jgi:hypothetical protein
MACLGCLQISRLSFLRETLPDTWTLLPITIVRTNHPEPYYLSICSITAMALVSTAERGDSHWIGPDEQPASEEEAIARLERWCEDGAPIFTREAFRDVAEQLERRPLGDMIVVRGLDGGMVGFDVNTGKASRACRKEGENLEYEVYSTHVDCLWHSHCLWNLQSGAVYQVFLRDTSES